MTGAGTALRGGYRSLVSVAAKYKRPWSRMTWQAR